MRLQLRSAAHRADGPGPRRCRRRVAGRLHAVLAPQAVVGERRIIAVGAHQRLVVTRTYRQQLRVRSALRGGHRRQQSGAWGL